MYPYIYRAYWREQGAVDWNLIESPSPITWSQETIEPSGESGFQGGQCSGIRYNIFGTGTFRRSSGSTTWADNWQDLAWRANTNGGTGAAGPVKGFQLAFYATGNTYFIRVAYASTSLTDFQPFAYSTTNPIHLYDGRNLPGVSGSRVWAQNYRITSVVRRDGLPDNCGNSSDYSPGSSGECITTFSTGLIISRSQCIEVTLEPPECECCSELLPKANAILSRLS